jgi:hypothetical protein
MSEYLKVLNRLQGESATPETIATPARVHPGVKTSKLASNRRTAATKQLAKPSKEEVIAAREPIPDSRHDQYAMLHTNLLSAANGQPLRALVFAGTAEGDSVRPVVDGLRAHLKRLGLDVRETNVAVLDGRTFLTRRTDSPEQSAVGTAPSTINLSTNAGADEIRAWLDLDDPSFDILLIDGGILERSVQPAILARACDGLVVVARKEITPRNLLKSAVERADSMGCRTLGLVLLGDPGPLPRWFAKRISPTNRRD